MTNLILSRYGLPPSQVKYEKKEDKERYLHALCQIDLYGNYEPLKELIIRSVYEAYKKEQKLRKMGKGGDRMPLKSGIVYCGWCAQG